MSRIWMPGGAGGADLDVVTAGAGDVLKGKVIVGPDGEPLAGTLALSGDAGDSAVLSGKTYYSTDPKQKRTGTMANQGAKTAALNCGGSYTIPAGYHNGQGKVTANSLVSQTGVQSGKTAAGAGQVLTGYEAWVNGGRVTGTMANQGKKETALNCGGSYTIPAGYHNGQGKVTANSLASQTGVQSGKTAAGAAQIQTGYEAWVNGGRVTGIMGTMNGGTYAPSGSQQTISCSGKKMNSNIVISAIPSKYVDVTANQTVFNNGVCRLIKRVYPYYVEWVKVMSSSGGSATYKWANKTYGTAPSGSNPNFGFKDTIEYGYFLVLDGSVDITKFKTISVTATVSTDDSGSPLFYTLFQFPKNRNDQDGVDRKSNYVAGKNGSKITMTYDISSLTGYRFILLHGDSGQMKLNFELFLNEITLIP